MTGHSDSRTWQLLGSVPPAELVEARLQLHRAAQVVSGFGATYVEHADDFSHTSMEWLGEPGVLAGRPTQSNPSLRVTLDPGGFALGMVVQGSDAGRLPLDGHTLDDAYDWVEAQLRTVFGSDTVQRIERPEVPTPPGPGLDGTPFVFTTPEAFRELGHWYGNAAIVLDHVVSKEPQAPPVRCWPHHFDIAVLISLDGSERSETARSIGVGMTPGDDAYSEPYWYVLPWPRPRETAPSLPIGRWHTDDWYGAVLPAREVISRSDENGQRATIEEFVRHAVTASRRVLERMPR